MEKINLKQKFALFSDYWSPKVIGELNQFAVKIVKVKGEFVWHHHDQEDELFFVVKGRLLMQVREGPESQRNEEETHLMLLEPTTTVNTGNVRL